MEEENKEHIYSKPDKKKIQYVPVEFMDTADNENDIDLIDLFLILWNEKKTILIITLCFLGLGIFHYSFGPKEYISEAMLLRESDRSFDPGLSFFQQFGFLGSAQQQAITADGSSASIPDILGSVDFQSRFLLEEVEFSTIGSSMSLYDYFVEYYEPPYRSKVYNTVQNYTIYLPLTLYRKVQGFFRRWGNKSVQNTLDASVPLINDEELRILIVSPQLMGLVSQMASRIEITTEGSLIKSAIRLPDPKAAADANAILIDRIQEYLINNRIEKARQDLGYVEGLQGQSRDRYEEAQLELATFRDENRGSLTATASTELERLQDEKNRLSSVYSNLSIRLEEARLKLQEDTPVFTMFQKPILPNQSTASSIFILPAFLVFGFSFGIIWVLAVKIFKAIRQRVQTS